MFRSSLSAWLVSLVLSPLSLLLSGCGGGSDAPPAASISSTTPTATRASSGAPTVAEPVLVRADGPSTATPARPADPEVMPDPEVLLQTTFGQIRVRLFPKKAPLTVDNFLVNYVDRGFYDQTIFHFVDKEFIIAAGGFDPDFQPAEPRAYIASEADNGLKNLRGTLAMARDPDHIDSANCQFFINVVDNPALDHRDREDASSYGYCVFGEVVEGMDVVDRIAAVALVDKDHFPATPAEAVIIRSATRAR
jgi:peptidyl-prolyl cis-trans isomerase A (cyclophilin A)